MDIENKANSSLVFYDSGFLGAGKILYRGIRAGYRGIPRDTAGYRGIPRDTAGYRGILLDTEMVFF